jgi:Predicted outer membrane protein
MVAVGAFASQTLLAQVAIPTPNGTAGNSAGNISNTISNVLNNGTNFNGSGRSDARFLQQAAASSLHEITLGNLAQTNSSNPDVQAFGAKLVEDHTAAYRAAADLASSLGVTVPTTETRVDQRDSQRLGRLSGSDFDAAFVGEMINSHGGTFNLTKIRQSGAGTQMCEPTPGHNCRCRWITW